jgi:lipopolysaccharide export system protein LptA
MKYISFLVFILVLLSSPVPAAQVAVDKITFSSDTMQYDLAAGRFNAEGNVTIKGNDLTVTATQFPTRIPSGGLFPR